MTPRPEIRILLIEDSATDALLVRTTLAGVPDIDYVVTRAVRLGEGLARLREDEFDVVLLDLGLPDSFGTETLVELHRQAPSVPVVVLTGLEDETTGFRAVQEGAQDYLVKNQLQSALLGRSIRYAIERHRAALDLDLKARQLAESEARTRLIIDANADAVMVVDANGAILFANRAAEAMFGRTKDELLAYPFHAVENRETELTIDRSDGARVIAEVRVVDIVWTGAPAVLASLRDITKRKQAEAALRESQTRLQVALETGGISTWVAEIPTNTLVKDESSAKLIGMTSEEFGDDPTGAFLERVHPDDRERVRAAVMSSLEARTGMDVEYRFLHPRGDTIWLSTRSHLECDAEGNPLRLIGASVDVTKRKLMEAALRASEEKFANAFRSSPVALTIMRLSDQKLIDVNESFAALTGYRVDEIVGRTTVEAGIRTDTPERLRQIEELRHIGSLRGDEVELRAKSGETRTVSLSAEVIALDGEPCALLTLVDMTERNRAQEQLQRFLSMSPAVLYALRVEPDRLVHVWTSENLYDLIGYHPEPSLGTEWWARNLHPEDRERILAAHPLPYDIDHQILEFRFRRKDGDYVWVRDEKRLQRDAAGNPVQIVGAWSDITERVQLEAQLRQAQKMEAIGQLSGGVAHDFNNLLTIIQGHLWMIEARGFVLPEFMENMSEIKLATERAADLTRQLLMFSRRQARQLRDLDLNGVVTETTKMLQRILGEDIRMQFRYSPRPLPIRADPGMMDQILLNLAVNARDAMPRGGDLIVETYEARLDESSSPSHSRRVRAGLFARLSVSDSGCGIPADVLPRIFEPFFTTKDVGKGTGLGLATVFGIVEQHDGWIDVESEVGAGTTFYIYLPMLAEAAEERTQEAAQLVTPGGRETILLVEDEPALRSLVCKILSGLGYQVLEAATGPEAVEAWREHKSEIRLLLTDLVMPDGMSGRDLAERFLGEAPQLKVLYTSGYSAEFTGTGLALEEGVNFIAKPFVPHKLAQTVRASFDTR